MSRGPMALRGVEGQGPFPSETSGPQPEKPPRAFRESKGFEKQPTQPQRKGRMLHQRLAATEKTSAPPKTSRIGTGAMIWNMSGTGTRSALLEMCELFLESGGFSKGACFLAPAGAGASGGEGLTH